MSSGLRSECEAPDDLARTRLSPCSSNRRDGTISANHHPSGIGERRIGGHRAAVAVRQRRREEQPVEDVLELGADRHAISALLAHPEGPAKGHILGGLPLPPDVVVERRGYAKGSTRRIRPRLRIQDLSGLRVEAAAVWVYV